MHAYRAEATVGEGQDLHLAQLPFPPGSAVEVIVLGEEIRQARDSAEATRLRAERRAAVERALSQTYSLGGHFPSRDELHER